MRSPLPGSVTLLADDEAAEAPRGYGPPNERLSPCADTASRSGVSGVVSRLGSSALGFADDASALLCRAAPVRLFFNLGTGESLAQLRELETAFLKDLVAHAPPAPLAVAWTSDRLASDNTVRLRTGTFVSPLARLLPPAAATARIQLVVPAPGSPFPPVRAVVLHFAATADQTQLIRRKLLATPLLAHGIASVLLLPAFYGARRPAEQTLHYTRSLSDFCLLTHSQLAEGLSLLAWMRESLAGPGKELDGAAVGLTGVSMGGAMAATVGAMSTGPVALAPCLGTWTGAHVFCTGALGPQVAWRSLASEWGGSLTAAKQHVAEVLTRTELGALVSALAASPRRSRLVGPRTLVMVSAAHDAYVRPDESARLFRIVAPTCAPGDAALRWIGGGHSSAVLFGTHHFVGAVVDAFELLRMRTAEAAAASAEPAAGGNGVVGVEARGSGAAGAPPPPRRERGGGAAGGGGGEAEGERVLAAGRGQAPGGVGGGGGGAAAAMEVRARL